MVKSLAKKEDEILCFSCCWAAKYEEKALPVRRKKGDHGASGPHGSGGQGKRGQRGELRLPVKLFKTPQTFRTEEKGGKKVAQHLPKEKKILLKERSGPRVMGIRKKKARRGDREEKRKRESESLLVFSFFHFGRWSALACFRKNKNRKGEEAP